MYGVNKRVDHERPAARRRSPIFGRGTVTLPARSGRLRSRRFAAGWLTIGTTAAGCLNYVYALGLTHSLTARDYAVFAGGQSLLLVKGIVGTGGIPWVLAREIGADREDRASIARAVTFSWWLNVATGLLIALVLAVVASRFASWADVLVVAATALVLSVGSTGNGYLQGHGRTAPLAVISTSEVLVKLAVGLVCVLVLHLGATGALLGPLAGAFVPLATLPLYWRQLGRPTWDQLDPKLWRTAGRISALQLGVGVLSAGDSVLVAALGMTRTGAAAYQAAATLGRVPLYVSNAISTAVFPTLRGPEGPHRQEASLRSYLAVAGFFALCLMTVPRPLLDRLFSSSFHDVGTWVPYTALLGLLIGLLNILVTGLQSQDRAGGAIVALLVATVISVGAMWVGGTVGGVRGLAGAAVAALLFTTVVAGVQPTQRHALRILATMLLRVRPVATVVVLVVAMAVVRQPMAWLVLAAVGGLAAVAVAFPELVPPRLKRLVGPGRKVHRAGR